MALTAPEYVPASHGVGHELCSGQKKPAGHGWHVADDVAATLADHEPAAHGVGVLLFVGQK